MPKRNSEPISIQTGSATTRHVSRLARSATVSTRSSRPAFGHEEDPDVVACRGDAAVVDVAVEVRAAVQTSSLDCPDLIGVGLW
jgi:hypothetical protein